MGEIDIITLLLPLHSAEGRAEGRATLTSLSRSGYGSADSHALSFYKVLCRKRQHRKKSNFHLMMLQDRIFNSEENFNIRVIKEETKMQSPY